METIATEPTGAQLTQLMDDLASPDRHDFSCADLDAQACAAGGIHEPGNVGCLMNHPVRSDERPETVIWGAAASDGPCSNRHANVPRMLTLFDRVFDFTPVYTTVTREALHARLATTVLSVQPKAPLVVLQTIMHPGHVNRTGLPVVHILEILLDGVNGTINPAAFCLKGMHKTTYAGAVTILMEGNALWGLGIIVDKALQVQMHRGGIRLFQAVAILATFVPEGLTGVSLSSLRRWSWYGNVMDFHPDALVPNLWLAVMRTPDHPALVPFHHFCKNVDIPDFMGNIRAGKSFTVHVPRG